MLPDGDNNFDNEPGLNLTERELLNMSAGSLVFYLFIATVLFYFFHDGDLFDAFTHGYSFGLQLLIGILSGTAAAGVIVFFSTRKPVGPVLDDFALFRIIKKTEFTWFDRIQVSLFAGVGEELLFRGAIQPLIGIWFTSLIFIAIHGYISFRSAGHILFTLLLFGLSMMLGYLFLYAGLVAAMTAHAVYDLLMLWWVKWLPSDD
jgi:membrane protease YdiL (CAAX protease family)